MSHNETTAQTPRKLCSQCGLCMVKAWPASEAIEGCVFTTGWLGSHETAMFGRERSLEDTDEMLFGISTERFCARMNDPLPGVQFTGIITSIAKRAFESGMVDAVITLHRSPDEHFFPVPVLARTTEDIVGGCGSKPVLAQVLSSLEKAREHNIRKLLVIGAPCHIHNLREFARRTPYLQDIELFVVGIPCTDNVKPQNFRRILSGISSSHETVRHYEFMQDFTVHLYHTDGRLERVPFFCLPPNLTSAELLTESCRSCFDYMNSLADITVGYIGAPLDIEKMNQWVLVRNSRGEQLLNLVRADMDIFPESSRGDRAGSVQHYAQQMMDRMRGSGDEQQNQTQPMSLKEGFEFAEYLYEIGPRELEFVRYAIDTHLMRNYYFVREHFAEQLGVLVPRHVYTILQHYDLTP